MRFECRIFWWLDEDLCPQAAAGLVGISYSHHRGERPSGWPGRGHALGDLLGDLSRCQSPSVTLILVLGLGPVATDPIPRLPESLCGTEIRGDQQEWGQCDAGFRGQFSIVVPGPWHQHHLETCCKGRVSGVRWAMKKAERQRVDASETWHWRRFPRVPWTARRSNQSFQQEINS